MTLLALSSPVSSGMRSGRSGRRRLLVPYYLCSALTADRLVPARGLLAVSTWPLSRRVIGPLSPRVDFLLAARRLAEQLDRTSDASLPALRLLWQFAAKPSAVRLDVKVVRNTRKS